MSRPRGEHGSGPERLIVADASDGKLAVPTFAHRFAVVGKLDEDGFPIIREEDEILLDWKQVRVHDLQQDAKPGVRDRRLQFQTVNNYEDSVEAPEEGMSPYAQAEVWTALNRSTREADGFGRVALPGSHRRIVGSEDGKFALATTMVEWQAAATGEVGSTQDRPPPEGVAFKEPGIESGSGGTVSRSSPSVTVGGVTVFGDAAVGAARDAVNAGASPSEILSAAESGKFTPPTVVRDPAAPPAADEPPAPAERPGGYVVNEGKKIGLLGTLVTPALGEAVFPGREGEEIGVLPLRGDAQIAASKERRGRLHLKVDDVKDLPEDTKSQRVKGWLMFDSSAAGQDSKLPGDMGQWRPVLPINAKIPPSRDPPPPPPKPKPKEFVFVPGGNPQPGGSGSKGKAELYPGGSSGETPPSPPGGETGDGLAGGDLTPVGVATGAGGGAAPEGNVVAGGTGTTPVRTPGASGGEGPAGVAAGPVANPQSQQRDLTGQLVAAVPCPLTTSGGAVAALPPSSAPEGNTKAGEGASGAADPDAEPFSLPTFVFFEPGFPAVQVAGNTVLLGGGRAGATNSGHAVEVKGSPVVAAVPFGSHNVLTTPVPVMGQPGGPTTVEDQLAWLSYSVESLRQVVVDGAFGGPGYLASNVAVIHENGQGNPPAGSHVGAKWTARPGETVDVRQAPLSVPGTLVAEEGGRVLATGAGVFEVVRRHEGAGSIVDQRPAILAINTTRGGQTSTADAYATHDRRFAVTGDGPDGTGSGGVLSSSLVAHRVAGESANPFEVATVPEGKAGRNPTAGEKDFIVYVPLSTQVLAATRGFLATKPVNLGGNGGGLLTTPLDDTVYVDALPLRTRGGSILIADDVNGTTAGGFTLTKRNTGTTVLSMTASAAGNTRSRMEVDVLDPEAILFVPVATRPAELAAIPGGRPGLWVDTADERPVYFTGDTLGVDRPLAFLDEVGSTGLPKRYVEGLVIRYASSSTVTVSAGKARDKADGADMTLSSQVTVDKTSANAALGYERKTLTGTHTLNFGAGTVVGSGSAYLTEFGTRALSAGTVTNAATALTGTGTKFLSEVAVNDLIGNNASGYYRVTAVASDTSLTLINYPSGAGGPSTGVDFSGATVNVIEQPVIESAAGKAHGVSIIFTNTDIYLGFTTASATETGVAAYASSKSALDSTSYTCLWRAVWLLSGGSGTTVALSTQRTTPYLSITGYTTSYRRIGWVRIDSSGNVLPTYSTDGGGVRTVDYESNSSATEQSIASNLALTTSWQTLLAGASVPPTSRRVILAVQLVDPNTVGYTILRGRNLGNAGASVANDRACGPPTSTSTRVFNTVLVPCDGAQAIEVGSNANTGDGSYIAVLGYEDTLE